MTREMHGDPETERLREELAERDAALERHAQEEARLRARAAHDAHMIASLDAELNATRRRLALIEGSVTWQLFRRARRMLFSALGGERSRGVAVVQSTLRRIGRTLRPERGAGAGAVRAANRAGAGDRRPSGADSAGDDIDLPPADRPDVSLIIPVYSNAALTRAALESIRDHTHHVSYEVIVVDDAADAGTKELLERVSGARVIVNEDNIGYLRSVKRGADNARGRWLVLCNNDIEVRPGWLAALLECGSSRSDVAVVAPQYLYPDGSIAEAGAFIWNDGTGWNYGRGEDPRAARYAYRREIDYGSAAALMVRADFWQAVGGYDERFEPMYYEDTDLCFQARARGLRVMYEPTAHVIHVEGGTAGVDESSGHKRHQEANRPKLVAKWRDRLEAEHLAPDPERAWEAANRRRSRHVLIVDHRLPLWDKDSGALRMLGMIEQLIELDCQVVFLPDNGHAYEPYTRELRRLGVELLLDVDLEAELRAIGPSLDLVILSRPEPANRWLERVRAAAPGATLVYDTVDLHWLREARGAAREAGKPTGELVLSPSVERMRALEADLVRGSDATIVVTDNDGAFVREDVPEANVLVLPNVNPVRVLVPPAPARHGVLFVGGFEHPPNASAALTLVNEVMPLVWRERPDVPVTIVGPNVPPDVNALSSALVDVTGWVADLDPMIDSARALVAPLHFGAGLKGKVTQALAAGLPVVTTAIGAEGLDASDGVQMLIGETPAELAERTLRLLADDELWAQLSAAGQSLAAERCSPELMRERLADLLALKDPGYNPPPWRPSPSYRHRTASGASQRR